jgi:hypothetical protein
MTHSIDDQPLWIQESETANQTDGFIKRGPSRNNDRRLCLVFIFVHERVKLYPKPLLFCVPSKSLDAAIESEKRFLSPRYKQDARKDI